MVVHSGNRPIPPELQAPESRPSFLVPQPWLAQLALVVESWTRRHSEDLKKIGIEISGLPYWRRYELQDNEVKHGLLTKEKGSWLSNFLFCVKNEEDAQVAQRRFASGMMWEMTKNLVGEKASLSVDLVQKNRRKRSVGEREPGIGKREWPMTVRVLKRGVDGMPVSFVDMVFERGDNNPFTEIEWQRIVENDEIYIKSLGEKITISQTRSLDDWYVEGSRNDKFGTYYRPDIVVGHNLGNFRVDQMSSDRRPLLTIGLEQNKGSVTGVTVGVQTHLPFNGMDMMGMIKEEKKPYSRDAAFEAVVQDPKILSMIDGSREGKTKLQEYRREWEERTPKSVGFNTFLAKRYAAPDPNFADERTKIEQLLAHTSFEEKVMAEFSRLTDAQKVVESLKLPEDLSECLIELPKKIKEVSGEKVAGIMFLSLATYLTDHEAQGFAVGPEAMYAIMGELGYASVASAALNRVEAARTIIGDEGKIATANAHFNKMRAVEIIKRVVGRDKRPEILAKRLENLVATNINDRDEARVLARKYASEILGQYMGELDSVNDYLEHANGLVLEEDDPVFDVGGLMLQLDSQNRYLGPLVEELTKKNPDISGVKLASDNLLNLCDGDFGFSLSREEMVDTIERISRSNYAGELRVTENGVDWGTIDPIILSERIDRLRRAIVNVTYDKYRREGLQWLISQKEAEVKAVDTMEVARLTDELTKQVGFVTEVAKDVSLNPANAVSSMQVRLGVMKTLEFLGLYGAAGLVADSRPQENASKIVVRAPDGFELIFETALDANHTTVGVGQVNETISRKEASDNPRAIMEVVLPYLRANPELGRELRKYLEREGASERDINLIHEMLNGEDYICFTDRYRSGTDLETDRIELWGEGYIARKNRGARNARYRRKQQHEARIFMRHMNGMMQKIESGTYMIDHEVQEELNWFRKGGFSQIWSETNRYKLEAIRANLSQLALIFGLYVKGRSSSEANEQMLLQIRGIQEREMQRIRGLKTRLKQVYRGELRGGGQ